MSYNSGGGNGAFGLGWSADPPSVKRKTEKQLPRYRDEEESDTFILGGAEDLVPLLEKRDGAWKPYVRPRSEDGVDYSVRRYRPRVEGSFARIEKWEDDATGETHWRTVTGDDVHSYYGLTQEGRVSNPDDQTQVYEWLLCRTHDDKGEVIVYRYKKEDFAGLTPKANEKNRIDHCTQVYLKQIFYGNRRPYYLGDALPAEADYLFCAAFDYGEHELSAQLPRDVDVQKNVWLPRKDPFSTYRAGFEIRTYRRCRRVLMFHCFDVPDLPHTPYLTKSLELVYDDDLDPAGGSRRAGGFSFLARARQCGHRWDGASNSYRTKRLPDFELSYQPHEWKTEVIKLSPADSAHAPVGLNDKRYLWVDLFSEGIAGILTEQAGGWFYKSNLGDGKFSPARPVAPRPSFGGLASGTVSIRELEADGVKYLVQDGDEPQGFFKLTPDEEWQPFKSFTSSPRLDPLDQNTRLIDLSGDGRADMLRTEERVLRWHPSAGEGGFEVARAVTKEFDEERGPAVVFADQTQSIFLADMSGDGLTDIVRVRNGEVCYWPNLGYGRFGAKVSMDDAPLFDHPDSFNPAYLRLADIDGSGTTDIIYLGRNEFRAWMNLDGNAWAREPRVIPAFPQVDDLADVYVLDFLGAGTACIVYSSAHPRQAGAPLQYVDLLGGKKPHLLVGYRNNCGKEVSLEYKSSAHFYLQDKREGRRWLTKLPFPVHCIARVRAEDKVRETVFTNSYRYSHGYFDHVEKEFRGFARVEQLDAEEFSRFKVNAARNVVAEDLHQPPVRTVSWFHTGAFFGNDRLLHQCREEYFKNSSFDECELPEPFVGGELTAEESREASRACKGFLLRSEVYAADGSALSDKPYAASQSNCEVRLIQPRQGEKCACFLVVPSESISYGYERNPADPRVSHSFVLETDALGNVKKSASVVYPRVQRPAAPNAVPEEVWEEQSRLHVVYAETLFTDDVDEERTYRLRAAYESLSYEVGGVSLPANFFLAKEGLFDQIKTARAISFEEEFTGGVRKRLSGHSRTYFLKDDLSGPLPLGQLSRLGITHQSYRLAFTKPLVAKYYGARVNDLMLSDARYVHSEGDDHWWAQTGTALYAADPRANFYMPTGGRDPFGNETVAEYDEYTLLTMGVTDPVGNKAAAVNDYRTLSPSMLVDPNLNRAAVETDELGLVVRSALMGKDGAGEGDTLADPTARMEYDLFNWQSRRKPNYVHTFARERHGAANPRWQESYAYSDGSGNLIMTKSQAEPGKVRQWDGVAGRVEEVNAEPRWVGNGRTILNNKGNPVKQYEPYFSATHEYESEDALVETGFTPTLYYDPVGRNIRTEYPNGTFSKVEFDAWLSKSFDLNDTVRDSRWYADRGSPDPALAPEPADAEQRAAWLAARHHNTPAVTHTNSLGEAFYGTADYGSGKTASVRSESDLAGRYAKAFDQLGRLVSESYTNLLGSVIYGKSAEKGERWVLTDVLGRLVRLWDGAAREFRSTFDGLHRPVSTFVKEGGDEILFAHAVYGEVFADAARRNMRGRAYQLYDQAGALTFKRVDFKGNPLEVERRLVSAYDGAADWRGLAGLVSASAVEAAAGPLLESERFVSSMTVDALNRPVLATLPDGSVVEPKYNEANGLDSLRVKVRGAGAFVTFLEAQDYDAKGQRQFARYGNGLVTDYFYDPQTFRLRQLITKRAGAADAQGHQNLRYTFDPVGNILQVGDGAQQTHYFQNVVVAAENRYEYDALYQLLKATGREHAGLGGGAQRDHNDLPYLAQLPHLNDLNAVRPYTEQYQYDDCGNITQLRHLTAGAGGWTRRYRYQYEEDPADNTNRLRRTSLPGDAEAGPYSATYRHDPHGNMTRMPHLNELVWNFMDHLAKVDLGGGGLAFYVCKSGGKRMRKVIERPGGKKIERIYLGTVELYREYQAGVKKLERSTLHISDDVGRIAQVDTKLLDVDGADPANPLGANLIRYQYTNHLGSAMMETDDSGAVISYEEYHPYGTSSYRSSKSDVDLSLKRYRFSGKERDDETGFHYYGARYYASWLGRWTSSDPAGVARGLNLFKYCSNNPVNFYDQNGTDDVRVLVPRHYTGHESFERLQRDVTNANLRLRPDVTAENYQRFYIPNPNSRSGAGGVWNIVDDAAPSPPGDGGSQPEDAGAPDAPSPPASGNSAGPPAEPTPSAPAPPSPPPATSVGEPGLAESLIPVWGAGRESVNHFQRGNYVRGVLWGALAISDIFLVKALVVGAGRLVVRGASTLAVRETASVAGRGGSEAVAHLTSAAGEQGINATQRVGGRWGVFALDAGRVPTSQFGKRAATLVPGDISRTVLISGNAVNAFRRPPIFGIFSGARRAGGVRSTALGSVDLASGRFIEGEIFRNGIFRQATFGERAMYESHQFLLDYGIDGLIYGLGKTGLFTSDLSADLYANPSLTFNALNPGGGSPALTQGYAGPDGGQDFIGPDAGQLFIGGLGASR